VNISEEDIIDCFYNGITDPGIYRDFGRNRPKTVAGLHDMMHDWSGQEEKMREWFPRHNDNNPMRTNDNSTDKSQRDLTDMLVPSKSPFYGIVPGNAAHPLGTVVLPVTFGMRENYRTEFMKFEVANFDSLYHAILGRPALAKFMAVPHYVYLLLKMRGRSGVLTLRGDLKKSYDCNQEAIQYTSTTRVPDASQEVLAAAQQLSQAGLEIPTRKASKSTI
jgi:hypothetical protein